MTKRFGKVRLLASGKYSASFVAPDRRRVFAPITFHSEDEAETWLATQRTEIVRGVWKAHESGRVLLNDYARDWLRHRTDLKPRTMALYAGLLSRHILPDLGDLRLRDIGTPEVRVWFADLGTRTGPTARAQAYRLLRTVLNQAIRDGHLETNPCQIRKAGVVQHAERPALGLGQIHRLAESMPPRYRAMVLVAAYGGLRFGELTALTRVDVTLPADGIPRVHVRRAMHRLQGQWLTGTPKTHAAARTVALPAFLAPIMEDHLERFVPQGKHALVFGTRSGRPLSSANFGKTWRRIREKEKVPSVRFHDLRHAAATLAVQRGATLKDTMARLGHTTPRAALIYQHTASDRDELIARTLDEARSEEVGGKGSTTSRAGNPTRTAHGAHPAPRHTARSAHRRPPGSAREPLA